MGTRGNPSNKSKGPDSSSAPNAPKSPPGTPGSIPAAAPASSKAGKPVVAKAASSVPNIPPVQSPAAKPDVAPGGFLGSQPGPAPYAAVRSEPSAPGTVRKDAGPTPASLPGWNREFGESAGGAKSGVSAQPKPATQPTPAPLVTSSKPAVPIPTGISAAAVAGAAGAPAVAPKADRPAPTPAKVADAERQTLANRETPTPVAHAPVSTQPVPKPGQWTPPATSFDAGKSNLSSLPPSQLTPTQPTASEPPPSLDQPPLLFEIAWEVCWQLGGIYTVLRSKAQAMIDRWGDRYCLIGPYNPSTAAIEFEEQQTYGPIREAMNKLRDMGIPCHFGRWMITGRPRVILIDYRARFNNLNNDKFAMWNDHKIELPANDGEVNEVVAFGFAVTEFFRLLSGTVKDRPILAHFHEWMGGVAVPRIAHLRLPISTVFTTHATLLGRYLAGDNPYFYDHLQFLDPDAEAGKYQIYPRFAIERAAAHSATVFTTVSDVTGVEAEKLLGRAPDLITPNGINLHKFAAPHEFQHLHAKFKEKINEFVMGHFFPSYSFDLDRTLYIFTSGRYEYRNKGMDMFIEAMHRLNWRLKGTQNPPTIVAFVITRAPTRSINVRVLQNQSMYEDLRHTCTDIQHLMGSRLLNCVVRGSTPTANDLLKEDEQVRLKRTMHAWKTNQQPLIVTHDLADDAGDPVLRHFRHRQMFNAKDDPVKVIFHPDFLSVTNPVMAMDYEQFVRGTHMGVFPSYYEPWGYTPLECMALGVPAVTSDLAGFGSYVQKHVYPRERRDADRQGIHIINRRGRSFDDACESLVNHLFSFSQLTRRQRIEMRNRTERISEQFDWSALSRHYDDAHNLALQRTGSPRVGQLEVRMI